MFHPSEFISTSVNLDSRSNVTLLLERVLVKYAKIKELIACIVTQHISS